MSFGCQESFRQSAHPSRKTSLGVKLYYCGPFIVATTVVGIRVLVLGTVLKANKFSWRQVVEFLVFLKVNKLFRKSNIQYHLKNQLNSSIRSTSPYSPCDQISKVSNSLGYLTQLLKNLSEVFEPHPLFHHGSKCQNRTRCAISINSNTTIFLCIIRRIGSYFLWLE